MFESLLVAAALSCTFVDVCDTTHQTAIEELADDGIIGGFPDGSFRPGVQVTRGQVATLVYYTFDLEPANAAMFSDSDGAHGVAIDALAAEGIVGGWPDGTFRPFEAVSRGQVATMVVRAATLNEPDAEPRSTPFRDVAVGVGHGDAIGFAWSHGWMSGYPDGSFRPNDPVTRGQVASMLVAARNGA